MKSLLQRVLLAWSILSYPCIAHSQPAAAPEEDLTHRHLSTTSSDFDTSPTETHQQEQYYQELKEMLMKEGGGPVNLVMAIHPFPNVLSLLDTYQEMICCIFLKSPDKKSAAVHESIAKKFKNKILGENFTPEALYEMIYKNAKSEYPVVTLDIGAKFIDFRHEAFKRMGTEKGKSLDFLGTVEDTLNGHKRYEDIITQLDYPVISIAKSQIKAMEDHGIGIFIAIQAYISCGKYLKGMNDIIFGIVGTGRLGFGGIHQLATQTQLGTKIRDVLYYDCCPEAREKCKNISRTTEEKSIDELIYKAKVILLMTGNRCLSLDPKVLFNQLRKLHNKFLAVCTSLSDEVDFGTLREPESSRRRLLFAPDETQDNPDKITVENDDFFERLKKHICSSKSTGLAIGKNCSPKNMQKIIDILSTIPEGHVVLVNSFLPAPITPMPDDYKRTMPDDYIMPIPDNYIPPPAPPMPENPKPVEYGGHALVAAPCIIPPSYDPSIPMSLIRTQGEQVEGGILIAEHKMQDWKESCWKAKWDSHQQNYAQTHWIEWLWKQWLLEKSPGRLTHREARVQREGFKKYQALKESDSNYREKFYQAAWQKASWTKEFEAKDAKAKDRCRQDAWEKQRRALWRDECRTQWNTKVIMKQDLTTFMPVTLFSFDVPEIYKIAPFLSRHPIVSNNCGGGEFPQSQRNKASCDLDIFAWENYQEKAKRFDEERRQKNQSEKVSIQRPDYYTYHYEEEKKDGLLNIRVFIRYGAINFFNMQHVDFATDWDRTISCVKFLSEGKPPNFEIGGHTGPHIHATFGALLKGISHLRRIPKTLSNVINELPKDAQVELFHIWQKYFAKKNDPISSLIFPDLCKPLITSEIDASHSLATSQDLTPYLTPKQSRSSSMCIPEAALKTQNPTQDNLNPMTGAANSRQPDLDTATRAATPPANSRTQERPVLRSATEAANPASLHAQQALNEPAAPFAPVSAEKPCAHQVQKEPDPATAPQVETNVYADILEKYSDEFNSLNPTKRPSVVTEICRLSLKMEFEGARPIVQYLLSTDPCLKRLYGNTNVNPTACALQNYLDPITIRGIQDIFALKGINVDFLTIPSDAEDSSAHFRKSEKPRIDASTQPTPKP